MIFLTPLSKIYGFANSLRYMLYKRGIFSSEKISVPVISVGNLVVGGTGKTPFVDYLLCWAKSNDLRPAVVSRGYKRKSNGIQEVVLKNSNAAEEFGDEPTMLKLKHSEVPIWVGESRLEASQEIVKRNLAEIIFADDAFQHHVLGRDLDIVLLDGTRGVEQFKVIPSGFGRESIGGLSRADVVVINRVNLASPKNILDLRREITPYFKGEVVESAVTISEVTHMGADFCALSPEKKYVMLSGIAQPKSFEDLLQQSFYKKMIKHYIFKDHYKFSRTDLENIKKNHPRTPILVTEKDAVKLRSFSALHNNVFVVKIALKLVSGEAFLKEKLNSFLK